MSLAKKPSTALSQDAEVRGEMEDPARMTRQPRPDFGMLVAAVIVEDDMNQLAGRDVALEAVEKAQKLLVPVALHALPDDTAVEHVQGGKQCRRSIADIIVRRRPGATPLHRQAGLGSVHGLDLAFFINREHDRMRRWVDVKPGHIAQLGGKLRVAAELEGPQSMRRQAMDAPDLLHRADRQAHGIGHRSAGPVRGRARGIAERALDQSRDEVIGHWRFAGLACLVMHQPVDPRFHKPALPAPDAGFRHAGPTHDLRRATTFSGGQDYPSPPYMLLRTVAIRQHRLQSFPIPRLQSNLNTVSRPPTVAHDPRHGNLLFRSDH